MSMGLNFKKKYNEILKREEKGRKYINSCNDEEFDKWYKEYLKITRQLSFMMNQYKEKTGKEMEKEEILKGFSNI